LGISFILLRVIPLLNSTQLINRSTSDIILSIGHSYQSYHESEETEYN